MSALRRSTLLAAALGGVVGFAPSSSAPICPNCGERVGERMDEQERHATGACVPSYTVRPSRHEQFMARQLQRAQGRAAVAEAERAERREAERRANEHAVAMRVARADAKRQRKAAKRVAGGSK